MAEPIGSGRRFQGLSSRLAQNPKIKSPGGLAYAIGKKKYGAKRMAELAQAGKRRKAGEAEPAPAKRVRI